ncbi:DUF4048 domain-containing protein [Microdochium nivale]|nr:DUF4048 domain-containing protein [Microdochium nivale]
MTTGLLSRICLVTVSSSYTPLPEKPLYAAARASHHRRLASSRLRHRRAQRASPTTHFAPWRRRPPCPPQSTQASSSGHHLRRTLLSLPSTTPEYAPPPPSLLDDILVHLASTAPPPPSPSTTAVSSTPWWEHDDMADRKSIDSGRWDQSVPQSPAPPSETCETRSVRSMSSASRNTNRLSITLPVALPNSMSSRPTPNSSVPPTPLDTPSLDRHSDPNDVIIAIASQERRILELREELSRAEGDLSKLKRHFTVSEGRRKRTSARPAEPLRSVVSTLDSQIVDDPTLAKHKSEMDRRKAILLAQSQGTPKDSKRRVMRGGHTRTLSLLSPTKPGPDTPDDMGNELLSPASATSDYQPEWQPDPARLNKRATWAPRQTQPPSGMKQIASDFRQGLWTFVEDLRQATVGDEGVSGTSNRTSDMAARLNKMELGDQDTIRASAANRPRVPFATEDSSGSSSPARSNTGDLGSSVQHRRSLSRPEPKSRKRFSWNPPAFDNLDDDDWSNWDSPTIKSSRWSGSTANGDLISAIPEKTDEGEGTGGQHQSRPEVQAATPTATSKLEELPQAILNRLTTSGLKGLPSQFIKDWERSLSPPTDPNAFEASCRDIHAVSQ